MNMLQRGVITLLRSAVTGEKLPLPEGFSLEEALPLIQKHSVMPMAYIGAVQCGIPAKTPLMQQLFMQYYQRLVRSEKQMNAVQRLFDAFEAQGIDYMPLKGCNLKALYPKPELRQMGDADVLIKEAQYDKIRAIVKQVGFSDEQLNDNVWSWKNPVMVLELHRGLISSSKKDYLKYYGTGWKFARPAGGSRFVMSHEDEFVFLTAHFAKHFRDGGIGLRHVMDLWVYRRAYPQMDEKYIRAELKKMYLLEFYMNLCCMLSVWFDGGEADACADFMSEFIFASGLWGTDDNRTISRAARHAQEAGSIRKGRALQVLRIMFPSRTVMVSRYPVLQKAPYLLPVLWVERAFRVLLLEREKLTRTQARMKVGTADGVEAFRDALRYVGLDYHLD